MKLELNLDVQNVEDIKVLNFLSAHYSERIGVPFPEPVVVAQAETKEAPKAEPAKVAKKAPSPQPEKPEIEKGSVASALDYIDKVEHVSEAQLRELIAAKVTTHREEIKALFVELGATRLGDLQPGRYPEFKEKIEKL